MLVCIQIAVSHLSRPSAESSMIVPTFAETATWDAASCTATRGERGRKRHRHGHKSGK